MKDIAADHTLCQENSPHFHGKGNGGPSPGEASLTELGSKFASQSFSAMSPLPGRPRAIEQYSVFPQTRIKARNFA